MKAIKLSHLFRLVLSLWLISQLLQYYNRDEIMHLARDMSFYDREYALCQTYISKTWPVTAENSVWKPVACGLSNDTGFFFKIACLHFAVITLLLHLSLFPCLMIVGAKCNTSPLLSIFSHVECYTQLLSSLFSDVICPSYRWSSFTSCSLNCFKQNFSISSCRAYVTCCQKLLIFVQIVACWFWVICEVIIIWVISL